jgi:hypothetical protein
LPGTEVEFAAPVWYPPSRWSPAEVVRAETISWSLEEPREFGVAVGVVEGPGFWELDHRLQPALGSGQWPLRLVHDGRLVWLVTLEADGRMATLKRPGGEP